MAKQSKKVSVSQQVLGFWTVDIYARKHKVSRSTARYRLEKLLLSGKWEKKSEFHWTEYKNPYHNQYGGLFAKIAVYEQISE